MNMQQLRRRQAARQLEHSRIRAPDRFDVSYDSHNWHGGYEQDDDDDDEGPERDLTCTHCHGTGGDPWNDGITPCEHCDGEGYEWWS